MEKSIASVVAAPERAMFLDIETAGTRDAPYTTLIGWSMAGEYHCVVRGRSLEGFEQDLARATSVVTFNGLQFDVPFLLREFPHLVFPSHHVDLRYLLRRCGLRGGQKAIELVLGIARSPDIAELRSRDAIFLWREFGKTRDREHLARLTRYNRADVMNMIPLLAHGLRELGMDAGSVLSLMRVCGENSVDVAVETLPARNVT